MGELVKNARRAAGKSYLRRHASTMVVAFVTAAITAGMPAVAEVIADFARNADRVDGRHAVGADASVRQRKGKLVATSGTTGKLPNDIIRKAPNANHLDGRGFGETASIARADTDSSPAVFNGPFTDEERRVNRLRIRLPTKGVLVLQGTCEVTVDFFTPNQTFALGAEVNGRNPRGIGEGPLNRAQVELTFTADTPEVGMLDYAVTVPIRAGRHTITQILHHSTGTDSYYYTRNNLTVLFVPQGAVTYTDS